MATLQGTRGRMATRTTARITAPCASAMLWATGRGGSPGGEASRIGYLVARQQTKPAAFVVAALRCQTYLQLRRSAQQSTALPTHMVWECYMAAPATPDIPEPFFDPRSTRSFLGPAWLSNAQSTPRALRCLRAACAILATSVRSRPPKRSPTMLEAARQPPAPCQLQVARLAALRRLTQGHKPSEPLQQT